MTYPLSAPSPLYFLTCPSTRHIVIVVYFGQLWACIRELWEWGCPACFIFAAETFEFVALTFRWEKTIWPLCPSQQRFRMLWLYHLDRVDQAGQTKVFIRRKVDPPRWVTLLAEPAFCFSCKQFVTFYVWKVQDRLSSRVTLYPGQITYKLGYNYGIVCTPNRCVTFHCEEFRKAWRSFVPFKKSRRNQIRYTLL